MGDRALYQPLTREDRISVLIYRIGIVLSAVALGGLAATGIYWLKTGAGSLRVLGGFVDLLVVGAGLTSIFIHLYISRFHRALKRLFVVSAVCWGVLLVLGAGNPVHGIARNPAFSLLLLPLAGCVGFVTAKEAFCFRLNEGYLFALLLPIITIAYGVSLISLKGYAVGGAVTVLLYLLFAARKVFMPFHYDIGDKSAYQ